MEIIHPKLRASKGCIHKTITPPSYDDVEDDNIYTFITKYKNYLQYEELSPEQRHYTKQEQTMYVVNALKKDSRFKPGLEYVLATLLSHQRDSRSDNESQFPMDLEIDEIAVTIDERCPEYKVEDDFSKTEEIVNPYVTTPVVRMAKGRTHQDDNETKPAWQFKKKYTGKNDNTNAQICKACGGYGHCITNNDTICYTSAKTYMCSRYINNGENEKYVKNNTYRYKKMIKEKSTNRKMGKRTI